MSADVDVIHVSPHPDDEAVGCPALILALCTQGLAVTNIVTSLGQPPDHQRRRREAYEAGAFGGFEVRVLDSALELRGSEFELEVSDAVLRAVAASDAAKTIVVSPSPHDKHPRHEAVGRAVARAVKQLSDRAVWLMYGVWGPIALPTAYFPYDDSAQDAAERLLSMYSGEIERNDFRRLVRGRAMAAPILAAEQIFGFGTQNEITEPYAELYTEVGYRERWLAGAPRLIDPLNPLVDLSERDITKWVESLSPMAQVNWS
jgi:LmbE family N-acetylglucosaminyl deacetylase